jgi:hypothetical protein
MKNKKQLGHGNFMKTSWKVMEKSWNSTLFFGWEP